MVVFHNSFGNELATQQVTAKTVNAAVGSKRLLCPLQHEDGCVDGQPSLAYRLWQLLDWAGASGLQTSVLAARTSCSVTDVQTTLESSRYFIQLPGVFRLGGIGSLATCRDAFGQRSSPTIGGHDDKCVGCADKDCSTLIVSCLQIQRNVEVEASLP
jgi:hypothetical protein